MTEERLKRIEELLILALERLAEIEKLLSSQSSEYSDALRIAGELTLAFSLPVVKALESAFRIANLMKNIGKSDEISIAILKVLSTGEELTLSEVTRRVRILRGHASRRIIASRVRELNQRGLVHIRRVGNRVYVRLKTNEK